MSAQLQQQLARKGTDLSSAEQSLAHLQQELSQAQQSKHEACQVKTAFLSSCSLQTYCAPVKYWHTAWTESADMHGLQK